CPVRHGVHAVADRLAGTPVSAARPTPRSGSDMLGLLQSRGGESWQTADVIASSRENVQEKSRYQRNSEWRRYAEVSAANRDPVPPQRAKLGGCGGSPGSWRCARR